MALCALRSIVTAVPSNESNSSAAALSTFLPAGQELVNLAAESAGTVADAVTIW